MNTPKTHEERVKEKLAAARATREVTETLRVEDEESGASFDRSMDKAVRASAMRHFKGVIDALGKDVAASNASRRNETLVTPVVKGKEVTQSAKA